MRKPKRAGKPVSGKAPAAKRKKQAKGASSALETLNDEAAATLWRTALEKMEFDPDMFGSDPVELFGEYLDACAAADVEADEKNELLAELADALEALKIDVNGGDREAREEMQAICDLLDAAIENSGLNGPDLMLTARALAGAGWIVPDRLKQAVATALQTAPSDQETFARDDIVSTLLELAEAARQNPFAIHEQLDTVVAALPPQAAILLLSTLVRESKGAIDETAAGFLLHPEAEIARAVSEALAASAAKRPVASALVERLVRMRPWLPPARQAHLDATIRAMRLNALPPVRQELPKVIKCYASVCDGSGTRSIVVTQRAGT
jgi:hypothetical protein